MRPAGVTNHYSRIFTPNSSALSNETFRAGIATISDNVMAAVKSVMTCEPDYLVMGMSAHHVLRRPQGRRRLRAPGSRRQPASASASAAIPPPRRSRPMAASSASPILSPYWPVMNAEVMRYFSDMGFTVVRDIALQCTSWTGIAAVTPAQCRDALRQLDGDDVDALVQVGTNLSMVAAGRRRRNVARQARHRHQHGHLLARAARQRHRGPRRAASGGCWRSSRIWCWLDVQRQRTQPMPTESFAGRCLA